MTKKELEDLVKRQSEQISELTAAIKELAGKSTIKIEPAKPQPWERQVPPSPLSPPWNWPQQTWLSADNKPICVMEELLNRPCETIQTGGDVL